MAQHQVGKGGEIKILGEKLDRWHQVQNLEQPTGLTNGQPQGELWFRLRQVFRVEEIIGQRLEAQIQQPLGQEPIAMDEQLKRVLDEACEEAG